MGSAYRLMAATTAAQRTEPSVHVGRACAGVAVNKH